MKKVLLLTMATAVALSSFAEKRKGAAKTLPQNHTAAKTTAVGDTVSYANINLSTDTLTAYYAGMTTDTGFIFGTNTFGDMGFAERYDLDSNVQVLGLFARFTGTVNPASTKNVVFNAWSVAGRTADTRFVSGKVYNSGLPSTSIASITKPITAVGIATTDTASDTVKLHWFTTPSAATHKFFVGYTLAYDPAALNGDTISLIVSRDNERHTATFPYDFTDGTDTIINNANAVLFKDNTWHDNGLDNFFIGNHFFLFPVVKINSPSGVGGITKNNFTLYGNYPNPANNETNIKFAVANNTEVTVTVYDMAGKVINTIKQNCNAGTQIMVLNTSTFAAGEYLYLVHTAEGEGIASKFTVAK